MHRFQFSFQLVNLLLSLKLLLTIALITECRNRGFSWSASFKGGRVFSHDVTVAMLLPQNNREGKSSRHVAMAARVLDDDKPIKSLKSVFALFQASPILFNFVWFGKSWRNFLWDRIYRYLSLEKESDNFCVVFTYSIKWAREIRKFHVVVVQRWQRNVENSMIHVQSCCLYI